MDTTTETTPLRAVSLVCTLSPSPKLSSSQLLAEQTTAALAGHGVTGKVIRIADHDVKPGVEVDMGDGDAWPEIRDTILGCDILILSTPIWRGHPSSITRRVLERLDAELGRFFRIRAGKAAATTRTLAANTAHLARRLKSAPYPPSS
ncbi:flavodoxin family protein [Streptomyces sp. NPDC012637]|uniref:flavodoxin family protein n=1 Tax=Streptomyces sp. NPDC012637 TaxID=3364842 RepID=UPI0036E471A1